jgi:Protein of unknown function (DUF2490)
MRSRLVLVALFASVPAAAQDGTQSQFLPEVNAFFKLSPSGRILALASGTVDPDSSDDNDVQVGLFWDQRLGDRVGVRGGYRFRYATSDPVQRESRIQLSVDFRFPVAWRLLATDRSMVELRWINGDPSQRYRNRLSFEREFVGVFGKAHTFVGAAEIFYDTRGHAWDRQEYSAAVQTLVSQKLLVELYYQRQETQGGSPAHVNTVGLTVQLFLDARRKAPTGVVIDSRQ